MNIFTSLIAFFFLYLSFSFMFIFFISQCNALRLEKATHFHYCPSIYLMKTPVCKPNYSPATNPTRSFSLFSMLSEKSKVNRFRRFKLSKDQ
ncbi:hypothetical protein HDV62DRAFT_197649 [Trichoderma sp. SZMC 28011]